MEKRLSGLNWSRKENRLCHNAGGLLTSVSVSAVQEPLRDKSAHYRIDPWKNSRELDTC